MASFKWYQTWDDLNTGCIFKIIISNFSNKFYTICFDSKKYTVKVIELWFLPEY